jgi:hypothetical protein
VLSVYLTSNGAADTRGQARQDWDGAQRKGRKRTKPAADKSGAEELPGDGAAAVSEPKSAATEPKSAEDAVAQRPDPVPSVTPAPAASGTSNDAAAPDQ